MTRFEGYLVVACAVVALCTVVYLYALVEAWLEVRLPAWRFRWQLRAAADRLEGPQLDGGGREPPPL